MPPDTFLGRVRFLTLHPVAAVAYISTRTRYQLAPLKAAVLGLVAFSFAYGWTLHHSEPAITALPVIGGALYLVLKAFWIVLDPLACCMALYIFTRR